MKHWIAAALMIGLAIAVGTFSGCATTAATGTSTSTTASSVSTTLQNTLNGFCALAPSELAALQAGSSALSPTAQADLPIAQQGVTTLCAPGVVASAANLQTFAQTVLPAFTVLALEYASMKKQ